MIKIEVFGPNFLWVTIDAKKNMRIIEVLEQVCLKKNLGNSDEYDLKHGNKILDLSFTIEKAVLPDSAKLELIKSSKSRHNSTVTVVIQLSETNARSNMKLFKSETSLYDVLKSYEEEEEDTGKLNLLQSDKKNYHPVIQYLMEEFVGIYALQNCTLKKLGLFSGRVSLRHKFREVDESILKNIAIAIDKERKIIDNIIAKNRNDGTTEPNYFTHRNESSIDKINSNVENKLPHLEHSNDALSLDILPIQSSNSIDPSTNSEYTDCDERNLVDFSTSSYFLSDQQINKDERNNSNLISKNSFSNFKFPEETKGKKLYENHLSNQSSEDIVPCDRNLYIYKIPVEEYETYSIAQDNIVPDQFFDHTVNDLQIIYRDLKQNVEILTEEPLKTNKLRSIESERRLARYSLAVIRIQFPDGYVVQANFKPLETVFAIYKLVNGLIEEKHSDFELYISPPKLVLHKTKTLFEADLVPLSLVYFSGPKPSNGFFLSMETRNHICTKDEADLASANSVQATQLVDREPPIETKTKKLPDTSSTAPKWFMGKAKKK